jgi:hypothetical protein
MIHNPSQENQKRYKHLKELTNKTIEDKKDYMRRKYSKNLRERGITR